MAGLISWGGREADSLLNDRQKSKGKYNRKGKYKSNCNDFE
jgi:hypothetical protein